MTNQTPVIPRYRDAQGRMARSPHHSYPLPDELPAPKLRDGRSDRAQIADPTMFSFRAPPTVIQALKFVAQQQGKPASLVIIEALAPVLSPVLQPKTHLVDAPPKQPVMVGQNQRLERLVPSAQKEPQNPVPAYDHVNRQKQRKAGSRPPPGLVDRGSR